jgi:branched-chain amino acid transport system substrate-binding protein
MSKILKLVAPLLLVLSLGACGTPQPKGEILVYVAVPLSGFQANGGQTVLGGANLKAEQVNRAGGVAGYTIRVIGLDDESDSEVAVEVANQVEADLAEGQNIVAVIGHYNSGQTLAAMDTYKDLPILVITPTASEVSITQKGYPNFFRVNANDIAQGRIDAEFLVNELDASEIAVVHNDTEYGIGLKSQVTKALEELGAEVVLTIQVEEGQETYLNEVERIKEAAPDAIFYAGYEIEAPYLRADLVTQGVTIPFLGSDGTFLSATIDEAGGAAEGMYLSAFAPSPETVIDQQWMKEYQAVEYRNPDTYSINGYAAMDVVVQAIKKANSVDHDDVLYAARQLDFDSVMGRIAFDEHGDVKQQRIFIFQVADNEFEQVWPQEGNPT